MKNIINCTIFLIGFSLFSQELYLGHGRSISNFEFTNSQEIELENLQPTTNSYIEVGYRRNFYSGKLNTSIVLNYNTYGSIGSDNSLNNFYQWEVDYLGVQLNLDVKIFKISAFSFYLKTSFAPEFFVKGTQVLNNQVINLTRVEEFFNTPVFLRAGGFVTYSITDNMSVYLQYMQGESSTLSNNNQRLNIYNKNIGFGLLIKIL